MKPTIKRAIKYSVASILMAIMLLFIANNIVFLHTHKLDNGKILVHAHPYKKSQDSAPFKKHQHTAGQFYQLTHLQLLFFVAFVTAFVSPYFSKTQKFTLVVFQIHSLLISQKKGRAPPYALSV